MLPGDMVPRGGVGVCVGVGVGTGAGAGVVVGVGAGVVGVGVGEREGAGVSVGVGIVGADVQANKPASTTNPTTSPAGLIGLTIILMFS